MELSFVLDGTQRPVPEGVWSLEDLLSYVMEEQIKFGRIITTVKRDGMTFSELYEHQASDLPIYEVGLIEIETSMADEVARGFMGNVSQFIDQLKAGFSMAADLLSSPQTAEDGFGTLAMSLEAMRNLKGHIEVASGVLDGTMVLSERETAMWSRFEGIADDIIDSQQKGDPSVTAMLLRERMPSLLDEWKEIRGSHLNT
jgi:hypothetical protein